MRELVWNMLRGCEVGLEMMRWAWIALPIVKLFVSAAFFKSLIGSSKMAGICFGVKRSGK